MKLQTITLENFRNVEKQTVRFGDGIHVLYGENGAGKTNLLEAIYLFAICKSHRTVHDGDFVRRGEKIARLSAEYRSELDGLTDINADRKLLVEPSENDRILSRHAEILYASNGTKRLFYEGVAIPRVSEFIGRFRAVLFTPDHLSLIKGAPELRRNFCDMALCQIRPGYIRALNEYAKILSQRNALLKTLRENGGRGDRDLLAVYSDALAEKGAVVSRQRIGFCRYLETTAKAFYTAISGGSEELLIRYYGSIRPDEAKDPSETDLETRLKELYTANIDAEIRQGTTKYGPHREDILFFMEQEPTADDLSTEKAGTTVFDKKADKSGNFAEKDENADKIDTSDKNDKIDKIEEKARLAAEFSARTFASQGQQRSAVLALKLAEGEMIKALCSEYPVYLFDDVLSELDKGRKERFVDLFDGKQVILTCCDGAAIESIGGTKIYVRAGQYT